MEKNSKFLWYDKGWIGCWNNKVLVDLRPNFYVNKKDNEKQEKKVRILKNAW